jgi:hypothetical protein
MAQRDRPRRRARSSSGSCWPADRRPRGLRHRQLRRARQAPRRPGRRPRDHGPGLRRASTRSCARIVPQGRADFTPRCRSMGLDRARCSPARRARRARPRGRGARHLGRRRDGRATRSSRSPAFPGIDGELRPRGLRVRARQNGWTVPGFETEVREETARSILQSAVAGGAAGARSLRRCPDRILRRDARASAGVCSMPADLTEPLPEPTTPTCARSTTPRRRPTPCPRRKRITYVILDDAGDAGRYAGAGRGRAGGAVRGAYRRHRAARAALVERLVFGERGSRAGRRRRHRGGRDDLFEARRRAGAVARRYRPWRCLARAIWAHAADGVFGLDAPGVAGPLPSPFGPALYRMNAILDAPRHPASRRCATMLAGRGHHRRARRLLADHARGVRRPARRRRDARGSGRGRRRWTWRTMAYYRRHRRRNRGLRAFRDAAEAADGRATSPRSTCWATAASSRWPAGRRGENQLVWRPLAADLDTPVSLMLKLAEARRDSFMLESVTGGEVRGRYSVVGMKPDLIWQCHGETRARINREARFDPTPGARPGAAARQPARADRRKPDRHARGTCPPSRRGSSAISATT